MVEGTLRSSYERSGVCFGGFRPTKHVEEPWASARGTHFTPQWGDIPAKGRGLLLPG
jgi:hypothetical protein